MQSTFFQFFSDPEIQPIFDPIFVRSRTHFWLIFDPLWDPKWDQNGSKNELWKSFCKKRTLGGRQGKYHAFSIPKATKMWLNLLLFLMYFSSLTFYDFGPILVRFWAPKMIPKSSKNDGTQKQKSIWNRSGTQITSQSSFWEILERFGTLKSSLLDTQSWLLINQSRFFLLVWYGMIRYEVMLFDVLCYDVIWRDLTFCAVMWRDVLWCDLMWCDMMRYYVMWFDMRCYDVVWCGVMRCDVMWCDEMWYDVLCYDMMWCGVLWFDVMKCDIMLCDMIWYDVIRCDVIWCDEILSDVIW